MECKDCPNKKKCRLQCMRLPDGKTCADCVHVARCVMMFGVKPKNTSCGWEPVQFKQKEGDGK